MWEALPPLAMQNKTANEDKKTGGLLLFILDNIWTFFSRCHCVRCIILMYRETGNCPIPSPDPPSLPIMEETDQPSYSVFVFTPLITYTHRSVIKAAQFHGNWRFFFFFFFTVKGWKWPPWMVVDSHLWPCVSVGESWCHCVVMCCITLHYIALSWRWFPVLFLSLNRM